MALPYKLFKSLEIDGTTMGLDPDLGKMLTSRSKKGSLTAGAYLYTDAYTIPEDGMYLVEVSGRFEAATSTGATTRTTTIKKNNGSPGYNNRVVEATNDTVYAHDAHFMMLSAGDTIAGGILSSRASGESTVWLEVTKILKTS